MIFLIASIYPAQKCLPTILTSPSPSSIAKMLKYSVRIEVIILKFSCVYRFISEGFEIVQNIEECSLN